MVASLNRPPITGRSRASQLSASSRDGRGGDVAGAVYELTYSENDLRLMIAAENPSYATWLAAQNVIPLFPAPVVMQIDIPIGYCQCGCGGKTNIAQKTTRLTKKGEYCKFIRGHYRQNLADRFWSKVRKTNNPDDCWEWQAGLSHSEAGLGYGSFGYKGKIWAAHRVAWELTSGEIPDGLWVLHKCDNRKCVNPNHLFLGTVQDNVADMMSKGRLDDRKGELNPNSKVTSEQVKCIRECYAMGGITYRELGNQFGLKKQQIYNIVRGRRWKHI